MYYTKRLKTSNHKFTNILNYINTRRRILAISHIKIESIERFIIKLILFSFIFFGMTVYALSHMYGHKIYKDENKIHSHHFGIILGFTISQDIQSNKLLKDRVAAAIKLYKIGKIQTILISAKSIMNGTNELIAIKNLLLKNNVPSYAILEDNKSMNLFDACIRAKKVFKVNKAILITQKFNLPRALYICNSFNLDSIGFVADNGLYEGLQLYSMREWVLSIKSVVDINYLGPINYNNLIEK